MICSQIALGLSNLRAYQEIEELKERLADRTSAPGPADEGNCPPIDIIIGKSKGIRRVKARIRQVADTDSSVLLLGETGVGKELVAKVIHDLSGRQGDFIPVNVAGLDDNIFADTLFGHKKGAFTGATQDKKGLFEAAAGGDGRSRR